MKKFLALLAVVVASGAIVAACSGSSNSDTSSSTSASAAPADTGAMSGGASGATQAPGGKSALPIPLNKLKSIAVAAGNVAAGKQVFDANCASCHGAGGKNQGGPGPTLAGTGMKAGQVAFMVKNPAAIDPDSGMPKLGLSEKQIADVSAYVASLK